MPGVRWPSPRRRIGNWFSSISSSSSRAQREYLGPLPDPNPLRLTRASLLAQHSTSARRCDPLSDPSRQPLIPGIPRTRTRIPTGLTPPPFAKSRETLVREAALYGDEGLDAPEISAIEHAALQCDQDYYDVFLKAFEEK